MGGRAVIAIDIGGTKTLIAITSLKGEIKYSFSDQQFWHQKVLLFLDLKR